jgi:predicted nucleic acid-binding protein
MNKLLLDTNIVIDLLARRLPFYDSAAEIFSFADKNKLKLYVSSLTFANTNYILSILTSSAEAREVLRKFKVLVKVLPLNDKIIDLALNDNDFNDFEDGLQYFTALQYNQNAIITRDLKDFKKSNIPVMTAEQFLKAMASS